MGSQIGGWHSFPRPLRLSTFQDPDEDADGDITLRGYSPAQISSGSHRTKDQMLAHFPRPLQLTSFEDSDEDASGNEGKGKDTTKSLHSPHHDVSDSDADVGDKTITPIHTPLPASKDGKAGGLRAAKFPRPLQLSLATQSARVAPNLDAVSSPCDIPGHAHRVGITDHTPVTWRDLQLFRETMEVGLMNVVKETMTRVLGEMQTQIPAGYNADKEDNEVPPHRTRRPKGLPRHRQPDTNLFHKNIREHALRLMHRTQWDSPFTDVPTKEEVEAYKPALGPHCTPDHFRVDLSGVPSTVWNKSAANVFVQSFRDAL
ncbi:hypothetical protein EDC04DRAFT_2909905 [Pisolithus marmoratus]|nr:hypothetical protein EDC04DRAFT_2909905 [Pisolithus marmoratus]